ncbi:MAG: hypothetical protein EBT30_06465 [Verrucomicrobia bacterium]|nr:hypothetical protein [Verrucomicrobiota bacterium]
MPGAAKPPADLKKETMRISLPPRPAAGVAAGVPAKPVAGPSPAATQVAKPITPVAGAGGVVSATPGAGQKTGSGPVGLATAAPKAGGAVVARTVVDSDSGGTALAVAALISSLVAFGIVLLSFLGK